MPNYVRIIIIAVCVLIVIISAICIITSVTQKSLIKKMYLDIETLFDGLIIKDREDEFDLIHYDNQPYDFTFETPNYIYYIKIIANSGNQEVCVNNSVKWQLRRAFNDESMRFVENVEPLMRMDFPSKGDKTFKKLYIIYPNARSLLKYINECEMVLIKPTTDVYGTNIIPYMALKDNPSLIKVIDEEAEKGIFDL